MHAVAHVNALHVNTSLTIISFIPPHLFGLWLADMLCILTKLSTHLP